MSPIEPTPYTPEPGGRYFVGEDGKRVRVDEPAAPEPVAPAIAPTPAPTRATPPNKAPTKD